MCGQFEVPLPETVINREYAPFEAILVKVKKGDSYYGDNAKLKGLVGVFHPVTEKRADGSYGGDLVVRTPEGGEYTFIFYSVKVRPAKLTWKGWDD